MGGSLRVIQLLSEVFFAAYQQALFKAYSSDTKKSQQLVDLILNIGITRMNTLMKSRDVPAIFHLQSVKHFIRLHNIGMELCWGRPAIPWGSINALRPCILFILLPACYLPCDHVEHISLPELSHRVLNFCILVFFLPLANHLYFHPSCFNILTAVTVYCVLACTYRND